MTRREALAAAMAAALPKRSILVHEHVMVDFVGAAGIRPGDIIVAFNGRPVDDPSALYRLVADTAVGSNATIRVLRDGRSVDVRVPIVADPRSQR